MTAVALGLVCWLVTAIVVESELFRPIREWVGDRHAIAQNVLARRLRLQESTTLYAGVDVRPSERRIRRAERAEALWRKADYLVSCHLCAGTWIGLALAAVAPSVRPFGPGLIGWALAGLLVKAIGHAALVVQRAGEAVAR